MIWVTSRGKFLWDPDVMHCYSLAIWQEMDAGGGGLYVHDQFKLRLHSNVGKLVYFGVH